MTSDLPQALPSAPKILAHETLMAELAKPDPSAESEITETTETQDLVPTESIQDLVAKGTQALAMALFESAAEILAFAVEKQVEATGQYAPECADLFFLYGRALLGNAILKNSVLGEKAEKAEKEMVAEEDVAANSSHIVIGHTVGDEQEEDEDVEDQGQTLQDIELTEETDDLELAWENLDVARLILSKMEDKESQLKLGDVHIVLGDVSLESENFELAVQKACEIKESLLSPGHRELAESHYKLALAFEYSEQIESAIENVNVAISVLLKKMEALQGTTEGKGKSTAPVLSEADQKEVSEIEVLLPEMDAKLRDLTDALDKEVEGGTIGEVAQTEIPVNVVDISNLVKKSIPAELKRKVEEAEAESKKAKLE